MQIAVHCMAALWLVCSALESSHLSWFCGPLIVRDPPAFPALKLLFNHQIVFSIMEINLPLRKLSEDTLGKLSTLRHCFRRCCHGPLSLSLVTLAYSIYTVSGFILTAWWVWFWNSLYQKYQKEKGNSAPLWPKQCDVLIAWSVISGI